MASIRTLKSGRHQVRWRDSKGKETSSVFSTRREAERFRRDVEVIRARGEDPRHGRDAPAACIMEMTAAHIEWCETVREYAPSTGRIRYYSLKNLQRFLRTIRPRGRLWPELLDAENIERFYVWLRQSRKISAMTAQQEVGHVVKFWRWCHTHPRFSSSMSPPHRPEFAASMPVLRPYSPRWSDCDAAISKADGYFRRLMVICRFTGLRVRQAQALMWEDVNLEHAMLTVRSGKTAREKRGRVAPMAPALVAELAGWGVRTGDVVADPVPDRSRPPYAQLHRAWRDGTGDVPPQPTHAFRRCFMGELRRASVQLDIVQFLVGHARGTAGDIYMDASAVMDEARRAVELIPPIGGGVVVRLEMKGE